MKLAMYLLAGVLLWQNIEIIILEKRIEKIERKLKKKNV